MLSAMRSKAGGFFAKLLLGLLVLTFLLWGVGDIFRHSSNRPLATVDGYPISVPEFERALSEETEGFRRLMGSNYSLELMRKHGLPEQVLNRMINQLLMAREIKRFGIRVDDAHVVAELKSMPVFKRASGQFDKTLLIDTLQQMGRSEEQFIAELRENIAAQALADTILTPYPVPQKDAQLLYSLRQERRTADLLIFTIDQLDNPSAPDETTLEKFYRSRAKDFTVPEYRTLTFITIDPGHVKAQDEEIYSLATKLEDELAGGATLEEAAAKFDFPVKTTPPIDSSGKERNGAVSMAVPLSENFLATAFTLSEKEESPLMQGRNGQHFIIRVDAITAAHFRPLSEVRNNVIALWQQEEKSRRLQNMAEETVRRLKQGESLASLKEKYPFKIKTVGPLKSGEQDTSVPASLMEELFTQSHNTPTLPHSSPSGALIVAIPKQIIRTPQREASQEVIAVMQEEMQKNIEKELNEQYMRHLRQKYPVEVNTSLLTEVLQ